MARSNVSLVTHMLPSVNEGFISSLGSTISSGASSLTMTDMSDLVDGSTFIGIIEPGGTKQQVFTGQVNLGSTSITGVKWTRGSNTPHSGGVTIVDYITGTAINMLTKWAGVEHNDDGSHSNITATTITTTSLTVGGSDITTLTPTGMLTPYAGSSAPTGWLLCNGQSLLRTTYAALFTVIGTAYGAADGTHFNVPDMRGRVPVGVDGTTEFATLGSIGGEKTHALTIGELAAHNHGINDPGHNHALWSIGQESNVYTLGGTSNRAIINGGTPNSGNGLTGDRGTGISTQSNGSGTAHNNLQPFNSVNFIIKV